MWLFSATLGTAAVCTASVAQEANEPEPINLSGWFDLDELSFDPLVPGERFVELDLEVDTSGRASGCRIVESSEDLSFDRSVCAQLMANARFDTSRSGPGRFNYGFGVGDVALLQNRTHIPKPAGSMARIRMAFNERDGVSSCSWEGDSHPSIDPQRFCAVLPRFLRRFEDATTERADVMTYPVPLDRAEELLRQLEAAANEVPAIGAGN
mgnify:CR=1 FL=1